MCSHLLLIDYRNPNIWQVLGKLYDMMSEEAQPPGLEDKEQNKGKVDKHEAPELLQAKYESNYKTVNSEED